MAEAKVGGQLRRTEQSLRDALLGLIIERGYEKTSVQDILDRAYVGRATFYAHYRNKEDLLKRSLDILREHLSGDWTAAGGSSALPAPMPFSLAFFRHVDEHRRLYRAVVGRESGTIVQREMRRLLVDLVKAELAGRDGRARDQMRLELNAQYVAGALLAIVTWWLDRNIKLSPEEMDSAFRKMTTAAIEAGG